MDYELHPLCTLFPRMAGAEFEALITDIRENGQREPIILHEGMILDGGNRYRACIEAGVKPQFMQFGGGNIVAYVLSANLHRRHMTAGQQAAIVASAQDWAKAQTVGRPEKVSRDPLSTTKERAAQSGASIATQKRADRIAKSDPDLAKKVAHGEISLPDAGKVTAAGLNRLVADGTLTASRASEIAKLPESQRAAAISDPSIKSTRQKSKTAAPSAPAKPALKVIEGRKDVTDLQALRAENDELRERIAELATELEGYVHASEGEKAAAAEIKRLNDMLKTVSRQRDEQMSKNAELQKQIKIEQRKLAKLQRTVA